MDDTAGILDLAAGGSRRTDGPTNGRSIRPSILTESGGRNRRFEVNIGQ